MTNGLHISHKNLSYQELKRLIEKLVDFTDSRDCFKTVDIAGGICYFLWSNLYHGKCEFINKHQGESKTFMRTLSADGSFIRHMEAQTIINKVKERTTHYYNERVSSRKPFGNPIVS